jgi:hypothetical protein
MPKVFFLPLVKLNLRTDNEEGTGKLKNVSDRKTLPSLLWGTLEFC